MTASDPGDIARARKARLVGIVLVATIVLWVGLQWVGAEMGWPPRFALLFDRVSRAGLAGSWKANESEGNDRRRCEESE